ncbi:hypothetical protein SAMN05421736_101947 [Evansella caseinilytica]|uniref:TM2 domain-containing protein n=1 Tax=Evansella caseinilytica TaxID=1503961 RepID=A0A1H3IWF4_9BACI|nr:hypothetical protein [Evansella caseinilytica]SDY31992.1 hypothetical protein SAMN05421736_101947 [Evansella caseinilytica]
MTAAHKSPITAFLCSFFPGGGQFYYGNMFRGLFYLLMTAVPTFGGLLLGYVTHDGAFALFVAAGLFFYLVSFVDTMIVALQKAKERQYVNPYGEGGGSLNGVEYNGSVGKSAYDSERFFTIVLSFIPGVGHFQLGLMNRGLTFITAFLGAAAMVIFIATMFVQNAFLIFMAFLPVVWIYSFFDAIQHLNKKQRGEPLEDRSIFEDFEKRREEGYKSKLLATLLAVFPGAGHLYLGYQRRGVQLMAAFLFSLYILDVMRLGLFMFFIPIIWFYSFFDGLQKASRYGEEPLNDQPIIAYFINQQKWVGIALIALGGYYMIDSLFIPVIAPKLAELWQVDIYWLYHNYLQTIVICAVLIGGGMKLLLGSRRKEREKV